jgi:uncharacterized phage infection (PIP) family protein YhgE
MTMHAMPPRPPGLELRVVALEATAEAHSDVLRDLRRESADEGERLFDDLAKIIQGQAEIRDGLQDVRTDVQGVKTRIDVVEVRVIGALDKDRSLTDTRIGQVSQKVREIKRSVNDLRRELGARVDEVEDDVEKSGQHGRDTMDRVAREAQEQEIQNLRQMVVDNKAAAEKAIAATKADGDKDLTAAKEQLANRDAALAKSDDRNHSLKIKFLFLAIGAFLATTGATVLFLANRALPEHQAAPAAPAITVVAPAR